MRKTGFIFGNNHGPMFHGENPPRKSKHDAHIHVTSKTVQWFRCLGLVVALGTPGCQLLGGARITELATGSAKPGNVATLVAVTEKDKPVSGLPPSAFRVSENDQNIDPETAKLLLLDPSRYAAFQTVLLVDISQAKDSTARKQLAKAAGAFVRRVRIGQAVTVAAYDGGDKLRVVGDYPAEPKATVPDQVEALLNLAPTDPSRNLRGAVVQGLELLDRRLAASPFAVRTGTLAVFARGPDLAGRTSEDALKSELSSRTDKLVYVGVSGETPDASVKKLGESGQILAQSGDTLPIAFEDAGALVDGLLDQYYLLSYCSPARAGERTLKVTVSVPVPDGKDETDSFDVKFDAAGFSSGCDSQKVPPLVPKNPPKSTSVKPAAASTSAPSKPSSSPAKLDRSPAKKPDEDLEAPVPAKPGYAE